MPLGAGASAFGGVNRFATACAKSCSSMMLLEVDVNALVAAGGVLLDVLRLPTPDLARAAAMRRRSRP